MLGQIQPSRVLPVAWTHQTRSRSPDPTQHNQDVTESVLWDTGHLPGWLGWEYETEIDVYSNSRIKNKNNNNNFFFFLNIPGWSCWRLWLFGVPYGFCYWWLTWFIRSEVHQGVLENLLQPRQPSFAMAWLGERRVDYTWFSEYAAHQHSYEMCHMIRVDGIWKSFFSSNEWINLTALDQALMELPAELLLYTFRDYFWSNPLLKFPINVTKKAFKKKNLSQSIVSSHYRKDQYMSIIQIVMCKYNSINTCAPLSFTPSTIWSFVVPVAF